MKIAWQFGGTSARRGSSSANGVRSLVVIWSLAALAPTCHGQAVDPGSSSEKLVGQAAVEADLVARGIRHPRVLAAMRKTPQYDFIPLRVRGPNSHMPAPIGFQQTISPPFVVASMTAQLDPKPTDKVLEIGTGSGYQSAVLSVLVHELYTIEIIESLGKATERRLARLGYHNVKTKIGDGYDGWAEHAPFDKIIVTCSPEQVPQPLVDQLAEGGLMVIPVGTRFQQTLYLMKKEDGELVSQAVEPTLFDPMIGTADDQRTEPQDVSFSEMVNGGFEAHTLFPLRPDGWHDLRQGRLDGTTLSGHGQLCLTFTNSQPGRNAQALQGIAVDGRQVPSLEISAWVRCQNVQAGLAVNQLPHVLVNYFDEQHKSVGQAVLGPWEGSFPWTRMTARVMVPPKARTAIVAIGLLGAIGEVSLDDVELRPATDVARRLANPASAVQR